MSLISTTNHHQSRRPRPHHSATRSGEASSLRLARLVADLSTGINQQTPKKWLASPKMFRRSTDGWVEVIAGPMFSGKSEELIRRVTRSKIARIPVQVFKPQIDNRYSAREVVSHSALKVDATPVSDSLQLLKAVQDSTQVIGIDEGQFFDDGLVEIVDNLAATGKQVIVAGLDTDYLRRPFEPIPMLSDRAEYVTKMLAVCHRCGGPALYTQRIVHSDDLVVLGATDAYEARCRMCYDPTEPEQPELSLDGE